MRSWLILILIVTPLLEMLLLVRLGALIGFWPTVSIVVLTALVGGTLAQRQGLATWGRFQEALANGRLPTEEIVNGIAILIAATLLLTPGVITDLVGFVALIPPVRSFAWRRLSRRFREGRFSASFRFQSHGPSIPSDADIPPNSEWGGHARRRPRRTGDPTVGSP